MGDAMVTGRMSEKKKQQGTRILKRKGMTASEAINALFDRIIQEGGTDFLMEEATVDTGRWQMAASFVDALPRKRETRFDNMSKEEIHRERLASRGLL